MQDSNRPRGRRRRLGLAGLGLAAIAWAWGASPAPSRARVLPGEGPGLAPLPAGGDISTSPMPAPAPLPDAGRGGPVGVGSSDPEAVGVILPDLPAPDPGMPALKAPVVAPELEPAVPDGPGPPIDPGVSGVAAAGGAMATQIEQEAPPPPMPAPEEGPGPGPSPAPAPAPVLPQPMPADEGATLSLRVDQQDMRRALELLGAQAGVNILASPAVGGPVSVTLEGVTFERALDVLLRMGDLVARREGGLIYVYTAEEAAQMEDRLREPIVRVYHLSYVRAIDVVVMIQPFLSEEGTFSLTPPSQQGIGGAGSAGSFGGPTGGIVGGGAGGGVAGGGLGAPGGVGGGVGGVGGVVGGGVGGVGGGSNPTGGDSYAVHDMVIVRDFPENVQVIDEIVARLDVQPLQVLIEAVIVSVELRDGQELGVNFALVDKLATDVVVSGSGALINAAAGFSPARVLSAAGPPSLPEGSLLGEYVDPRAGQLLPGYLADQGLKYGFVSNSVTGFIRALETLNKINILASPRVLVLNKQLAQIQLGQRLGYATTFTNLTTASEQVQFIPVGTQLALRPFVSQDGMIRLEVHPERSSGFIDAAGIPQLNTSELTTNIMVPDGSTIVIGGLIDSTDEINEQGVLGLSRLPFVGPLFRSRVMATRKQELLVLLTPRILGKQGLPAPVPGVAPHGPSGVPNSGPMPGPSLLPGEACPLPVPASPSPFFDPTMALRSTREARGDASGLRDLLFTDFGDVGPSTADEALQVARMSPPPASPVPAARPTVPAMPPGVPGPAPIAAPAHPPATATARPGGDGDDGGYRPGDLTRAVLGRLSPSASTPDPEVRPTGFEAGQSADPEAGDGRGYRPGDLTRAVLGRLGPRGAGDAPAASAMPPSLASAAAAGPPRDGAVVPVGMAQLVVAEGDDFRSIADRYYGSPALHAALWAVNRHVVPSPEALTPGATILLPPADVLERVSVDAIEATVRLQAPDAAEPSPRRRLFGRPRGDE